MGPARLLVENNPELFRNQARKNFSRDDAPLNTVRAPRCWLSVAQKWPAVPHRSEMRIILGVDKLNIDADMVGRFLNSAFKDIGDAELLCDLGDVLG